MKILHTADIHLKSEDDARWQALRKIVALARSHSVDVLVISGDFFENNAVAHKLRPKLRELFSAAEWSTLIVPGNHDADAYPEGTFFGERVTIVRDLLRPVEIQGVFFWGFPYEALLEEEILEYLNLAAGMAMTNATHILLFHGELLDITDGWTHYGDEGRQRYLPVKLSYFRTLPWQYVLAGHFHTNFDVHEFNENAYFVYPGSPTAITRRETGPRHVNLFTLGEAPQPLRLDTRYYEQIEIRLSPFRRENPLLVINEKLQDMPENVELLLDISGFFNGKQLDTTEEELHRAINKFVGHRVTIGKMAFRDIRHVLEDELFKQFMERLQTRTLEPALKKQIIDITLNAMMESHS